ncbi:MAG: acyl-CoA thioesterase [Legionellales bacterium]|nr:acyl-CoA thioesterase [Legionellales bacterium]
MKNKLRESVAITIPYFDVDSMEITWHGHYVKYFEVARCALLDKIGFNYHAMAETQYRWPIVDLQVRFIRPTRFGQDVIVTAELIEYENRLKMIYLIEDKQTGQKLTKGHTVQVAVDSTTYALNFVTPEPLMNKIKEYLSC